MEYPPEPKLQAFIAAHQEEDTDRLLLAAARYPDIDVNAAVDQILARRQIRNKLPAWYACQNLVYPSRLAAEQCSSEECAAYKRRLVYGKSLCDLTGGLGVDAFYLSSCVERLTYIERYPDYCRAAAHNFKALGAGNIEVMNADFRDFLEDLRADTFYMDPARRKEGNRRAFALEDCEPDVVTLRPLLLERCRRLIVKISPMADLDETVRLLPETREIHVVALKNECKEVIFVLEGGYNPDRGEICVHAVHLTPDVRDFTFTFNGEKAADLQLAQKVGEYLFEPHAALMKSGAFKLCATRFGLGKLHRHSHLYTSDRPCPEFPGRSFRVREILDFSGRLLRQIGKGYPQANITVRNFPLTVAELRKRSGIRDGGGDYLFATTLAEERKVIICCRKEAATDADWDRHPPLSCG